MKHLLVAVYDSAARAFLPPVVSPSEAMALRGWSNACNDPKSDFHRYPEDYSLHVIGEYDDGTGELLPCTPRSLGNAKSQIKPPPQGELVGNGGMQ